jgi:DNA primase
MIKHLLSRHYDPSRYVHQHIDHNQRILTVLLHNLSGQYVGFQQYRPDIKEKRHNDPRESRYFTYAPRDTSALWGFESYDSSKADIYVVEGIFKAATLHSVGLNALAVLTANPVKMQSLLWLLSHSHNVIAIGDNDKAGAQLVKLVGRGFQSDDVDEMPLEDVYQLIQTKRLT